MKKQKSQVLLVVLLIMILFMVIVSVLSALVSRELKMQTQTNDSLAAYYAAEAGIEKGINQISTSYVQTCPTCSPGPCVPPPCTTSHNYAGFSSTPGDPSFIVGTIQSYSADPANYLIITSAGNRNNIKRSLEVVIPRIPDANGIFWPALWREVKPN